MPLVSVMVPTHDHGPTLRLSLASALAQELEDIEVLVVGDGSPEVTREILREVCQADARVRFFEFPKGERHGEASRHSVLAGARGEFVAYLSDDDLWHPSHLTQLVGLLREADFAHTLPVGVSPGGHLYAWSIDLSLDADRRLLMDVQNRIPLSCAGHTMDLYRRLPRGWHPAPAGIPTDLHFFRQCLALEGCRASSGMRPSTLHFPSPDRPGESIAQRTAEQTLWWERLRSDWPGIVEDLLASVASERARYDSEWRDRGDATRALAVVEATATWRLRQRYIDSRPVRLARGVVRRLAGDSSD